MDKGCEMTGRHFHQDLPKSLIILAIYYPSLEPMAQKQCVSFPHNLTFVSFIPFRLSWICLFSHFLLFSIKWCYLRIVILYVFNVLTTSLFWKWRRCTSDSSVWICVCVCVCVCVHVSHSSCLTLCHPMNHSPPGSSVHGIIQARILVWVAIPFSRGFSWPRDRNQVSCITGTFFTI